MHTGATWKTLRLGFFTLLPPHWLSGRVRVTDYSVHGCAVRSYTSRESGFPVVVLHGLTRQGFEDSRLVWFCKNLAATGFTVHTPNLPGLCRLDIDPGDLELVRSVSGKVHSHGHGALGIVGFSVGGAYGLLASATPGLSAKIRFVLAAGSYFSLETLLECASARRQSPELTPESAYGLLVLDWRYRSMLPLSNQERADFEELMAGFCERRNNFSAEETALVRRLAGLPEQEMIIRRWKERIPDIASLSLAGNPLLQNVQAEVYLLHSGRDESIPANEHTRLAGELRRLNKRVLCHTSSSGSHVGFSLRSDIRLATFFRQVIRSTWDRTP